MRSIARIAKSGFDEARIAVKLLYFNVSSKSNQGFEANISTPTEPLQHLFATVHN